MEPREIAIIVYGARNLQGKKKGRHKYNVIFGVGTNRYRTGVDQQPSGNPEWTEESVIEVDNPQHPLVFIVREKEDILGQVSVPVSFLPTEERRGKRKFPLQPHRKCPNPQGELIFEAWISKFRPLTSSPEIRVTCDESPPSPSRSTNPFQALKESIQRSPIMARRNKSSTAKSTKLGGLLVRRNSRSLHDLTDLRHEVSSTAVHKGDSSNKTGNCNLLAADASRGDLANKRCNSSVELSVVDPSNQRPEILSITPEVGSADGGTVITIMGHNLGTCPEDVVGLFVCGANCLGSLVFYSPEEIQCTTKPWRSCRGYVVVETQSGGRGTSLVQYTFKSHNARASESISTSTDGRGEVNKRIKSPTSPDTQKKGLLARLSAPEPRDKEAKKTKSQATQELTDTLKANTELRAEIKLLKEENIKLREQNETLKLYVDHLVARVMEECPEALCAGAASAAVVMATR